MLKYNSLLCQLFRTFVVGEQATPGKAVAEAYIAVSA